MKTFDVTEREKFVIKDGDKDYICQVPAQSYLVEWGKKVQAEDADVNKLNAELYEHMGCPKEVFEKMSSDHIQSINEFFSFKKK